MTEREMEIKILDNPSLNQADLNRIVDIHINTFKGFFLTFLGKGFLRVLYQGFESHKYSGLLIAKDNKLIVGFLAYSENISDFYRYLLNTKLLSFVWYSLGAVIRRPTILVRLLKALFKPSESKRTENYIELSSIGIVPEMKEKGIGSKLIFELKRKFDNNKFAYIELNTDAENNESANSFYVKNGFVLFETYETAEGRKMNEYRWKK